MKTAAVLSVLALVGSTLAAPALVEKDVKVVYETVVHTVLYTPGAQPTGRPQRTRSRHHYTPTPTPAPAPSAAPSSVAEEAKPSSQVVVVPSSTQAAAQPSSTGGSGSTGYMSVVDEWRSKLGLKALQQSSMLQGNALNTVQSSDGKMEHKLNPGTYGQVLAPGNADDFEHVFVGGWLCEKPDMAGLDGICSTQSQGWEYDGQTGHAEILTSPDYSHIGCALYAGIWACDLGNE